ncbi:MAG: hypothetical protein WC775_00910 [Patescibacteria group bacterium]|jgi:hypothetical protein
MRRINLFSDTARFGTYKKYAYYTKISVLSAVSISFIILIGFIITLNLQLNRYTKLYEQIPAELRSSPQDTDTLGKTAFSYQKLQMIEGIYLNSPEYYKQYKYLLGILSDTGKFTIDNFSLDNSNNVSLAVTSSSINEVFSLIKRFDSDAIKTNFNILKVNSVALRAAKDDLGNFENTYSASFVIQFTGAFNEADI